MQQLASKSPGFIFLSKGTTSENEPYWAYLMVPMEKVEKYLGDTISKQAFRLEDFGEILAWDIGSEVPTEVQQAMQHHYNVQDDFVEQVIARLKQSPLGDKILTEFEKQIGYKPKR